MMGRASYRVSTELMVSGVDIHVPPSFLTAGRLVLFSCSAVPASVIKIQMTHVNCSASGALAYLQNVPFPRKSQGGAPEKNPDVPHGLFL